MSHGGEKPYIDKLLNETCFLRTFSLAVEDEEFQWHRDKEDRLVEVIAGKGWRFQRDNLLPVVLFPGDKIIIEKNEWHRIIKGSTDLVIKVHKK